MSLPITITNAGLAALINAAATGTDAVTISAVGLSSSVVAADPTLTTIAGEFARIDSISGLQVTPDTIHVVMQDNTAAAYTLNSFGLYLADGTLFALYGQAAPIYVKTAASIGLMAIDITFASALAAAITFGNTTFNNPPATATAMGVVQLATLALAQAGADATTVLTPSTARQSVAGWIGAATTTAAGLIKLATQALANAGADALTALTPSTAYNAVMGWVRAQDGSGSGLDADLLDGQEGAWYSNIPARLGFTPLNAASFTPANILSALLGVDGSGSGLDADLLDGLDSTAFLKKSDGTTFGSNANGYWEKRANGVIEQWGKIAIPSGANVESGTLTLPIPFTNFASVSITGNATGAGNTSWNPVVMELNMTGPQTASWLADVANGSVSINKAVSFNFRAIGI
jgi:hypothetical protein